MEHVFLWIIQRLWGEIYRFRTHFFIQSEVAKYMNVMHTNLSKYTATYFQLTAERAVNI